MAERRPRSPLPRWALLALAGALTVLGGVARAQSLPDVVAKVRPSVVAVGTVLPSRRPPALFRATGFVVADGRYVLTNAHAVPADLNAQQNEVLAVFVGRGQQFEGRKASVAASDAEHDLALLKIEGNPLPALGLEAASRVREGQAVAFTGFPIGLVLGLYPVTNQGIVSALTPIAIPQLSSGQLNPALINRLKEPFEVIQLDAIAYPGNSGSPLYDVRSGRVLGVVNSVFVKESKEAVLQNPSAIAYAIPIQHAQPLLQKAGVGGR